MRANALLIALAVLMPSLGRAAEPVAPAARGPVQATQPPTSPPPDAAFAGTLFYTDAERAKLDRARKSGGPIPDDAENAPPSVINGMVKRGDGQTTVWVDGVMVGQLDAVLARKVSAGSVGNPEAGLRISVADRLAVKEPVAKRAVKVRTSKSAAKRPKR